MENMIDQDLESYLLRHHKEKAVLEEDTIMKIFVQLALGLQKLHKHRILHWELKSSTCFLTEGGVAKLGECGLSEGRRNGIALCRQSHYPWYQPAELWERQPNTDKSDVWRLGVVLYEAINLHKPFEARSLPELRRSVVTDEPTFVGHCSQELKDLCLMPLQKGPASRPSIKTVLRARCRGTTCETGGISCATSCVPPYSSRSMNFPVSDAGPHSGRVPRLIAELMAPRVN